MQQTDWIKLADMLAEYRRSFRACVERQTPKVIAGGSRIAPSTLGHQISEWSTRKHPSAESAVVAIWIDEQHQQEVLGQVGRLVIRPPRLSAAEALRAVVQRGSKGFVSSQELAELLAQTDMEGM